MMLSVVWTSFPHGLGPIIVSAFVNFCLFFLWLMHIIIFNNIEMLFWNAEKTKLMLISVQVIKGRMPNKRGLNYCVYINIISQPCLPTSCEKNQQHKLLSYIYL